MVTAPAIKASPGTTTTQDNAHSYPAIIRFFINYFANGLEGALGKTSVLICNHQYWHPDAARAKMASVIIAKIVTTFYSAD